MSRTRRRAALLVWMAAVAPSFAQSPTPSDETPTFRTGTRLVEISVTVADKKGNPVTNLTQADFTIDDKGKRREIAFFKYEGGPQPPRPRSLSPGFFTNRTASLDGPQRSVAALVLDSLNTAPQDKARVRAQVLRYLRSLAPETRVAIFHMGAQLQVIHDFTDDAASLRQRFEKLALGMPLQQEVNIQASIIEAERILDALAGDPLMQPLMERMLRAQIEADQVANAFALQNRVERTLAGMDALGRHLSGIPGRKNMIWISGGISMVAVTGAMGMGPQGSVTSFEKQITTAARRLAQQGVVLYIVNARGLEVEPNGGAASGGRMPVRGRGRFESNADTDRITTDPHSALQTMASITGGRYLYNNNDMLEGFKYALSDLQGAYTLAFYASEEPDNKWRQFKVKVNLSGARVKHREGYISEPEATSPPDWNAETWRSVIFNPLGSSAVRLTAQCLPAPDAGDGALALSVWIDAASLHFRQDDQRFKAGFDIAVVDRSPTGTARPFYQTGNIAYDQNQMAAARDQGVPYQRQWAPEKSATTIRVIVRDKATGQYGTLDLPLAQIRAAQ